MPLKFGDQAFVAAIYLMNCLLSRVIHNTTPIDCLLKEKTDYGFLKVL